MSEKEVDRTFEVEVKGVTKEFKVKKVTTEDQRAAQRVYNQAYNDAVDSGAIFRSQLNDVLRKRGVWSDDKQAELTSLQQKVIDSERKLAAGGFKLTDAKALALDIRGLRDDITDLLSDRTDQDSNTCEGQADNARFNCLVALTVLDNKGKQYFKDYEDYINRATDPVAYAGASKLASIQYDYDENFTGRFTENKFLKEFGFADDKARLIGKDGDLVDEKGRKINKKGQLINDDGHRINIKGDLVDEDNNIIVVDKKPFLDDSGNEIVAHVAEVEPDEPEAEAVMQEQAQDSGVATG